MSFKYFIIKTNIINKTVPDKTVYILSFALLGVADFINRNTSNGASKRHTIVSAAKNDNTSFIFNQNVYSVSTK